MSIHSRSPTAQGSSPEPFADTPHPTVFKEPVQIQFDGSQCEGRHISAIGFTLTDATGTRLVQANAEIDYTTSVQTELHALQAALERAHALGIRYIRVAGDCTPVLDLIDGTASTSKPSLRDLVSETKALLDTFEDSYVEHIPRTENQYQDALAHTAFDNAQ